MSKTPPVYHRQRLLLILLDKAGGELTRMDFQKLLFLHQEQRRNPFYSFVPYKFGCYSFLAADDLELLGKRGWLEMDERAVRLADSISDSAWYQAGSTAKDVGQWLDTHRLRGNELLRKVYLDHPWYTRHSEIKHRVLKEHELQNVEALVSAKINVEERDTLYTIGYEGVHIEDYINCLLMNDVKMVCDVRNNPLSRKYGFSQFSLETLLGKVGICYCHVPELGIESSLRKDLHNPDDYLQLFSIYENDLPNRKNALEEVMNLLALNKKIALTCFEKEAESCHRHCVSDYLKKNFQVKVRHLCPKRKLNEYSLP